MALKAIIENDKVLMNWECDNEGCDTKVPAIMGAELPEGWRMFQIRSSYLTYTTCSDVCYNQFKKDKGD